MGKPCYWGEQGFRDRLKKKVKGMLTEKGETRDVLSIDLSLSVPVKAGRSQRGH